MLRRIYYFLSSGTFFSRVVCTLVFLSGIVLISLPLANRKSVDEIANIPRYLPAGSSAPESSNGASDSRLRFETDLEQVPGDVKFRAKTNRFSLLFKQKEVIFQFSATGKNKGARSEVRLQFTNSAAKSRISGEDLLGVPNGKPNYGRVVYENIYEDINAAFYGEQNALGYDLVVSAGGDPRMIAVALKGAAQTVIESDGSLTLRVGAETVKFGAPSAFQNIDGERRSVGARYFKQEQTGNIGFETDEYDTNKPLVIGQKFIFPKL